MDMGLPIGVGGSAAEFLRQQSELARNIIPESEGRIGGTGLIIQATGSNVSARPTSEYIVDRANALGLTSPEGDIITDIDQVSVSQMRILREVDTEAYAELLTRDQTQAKRGNQSAIARIIYRDINETRLNQEYMWIQLGAEGLPGDNYNDQMRYFRDRLKTIAAETRGEKRRHEKFFYGAKPEGMGLERRIPEDKYKKGVHDYWEIYDSPKVERTDGSIDWDKLQVHLDDYMRSIQEDKNLWLYVFNNTENNRRERPPLLLEMHEADAAIKATGYWDIGDRTDIDESEKDFQKMSLRWDNPNLDRNLARWYGNKPIHFTDEEVQLTIADWEASLDDEGDITTTVN
jgi:hypothetical protein